MWPLKLLMRLTHVRVMLCALADSLAAISALLLVLLMALCGYAIMGMQVGPWAPEPPPD